MVEPKTDVGLLNALAEASKKKLTAKELHEQRISFVMGSLKKESTVTRSQVEKLLEQKNGGYGA